MGHEPASVRTRPSSPVRTTFFAKDGFFVNEVVLRKHIFTQIINV